MSIKRGSRLGTVLSSLAWLGSAAWARLLPFLLFTVSLGVASTEQLSLPILGVLNGLVALPANPLSIRI